MILDHHLRQIQTQKLILSPQMRLYLKLLELPLLEMKTIIEHELVENPTLEETKEGPDEVQTEQEQATAETQESPELDFKETFDQLERLDEQFKENFYSNIDLSIPEKKEAIKKHDYRESILTKPSTLNEYLLWQSDFEDLTNDERNIAREIIGNINEDGYLTITISELSTQLGVPEKKIEEVLQIIQDLDPPGVAARNLRECLLLQLKRLGKDTMLAEGIISEHLESVQKKDYKGLAHTYKVHENYIRNACQLITHLEPKPGRKYFTQESITVIPDAIISQSQTDPQLFNIEMQVERLPRIRISKRYRQMLKDKSVDPKTRKFIQEKIKSAISFLEAFQWRKSTLRRITDALVKTQKDFLEKGPAALKPLRLRDISALTGIHESTISRAIAGKYISTTQGTVAYKRLFSSRIKRDDGTEESQKSIIEKIRVLIEAEDKKKPLSDSKIAKILKSEGIKVARRTVAKYRELLKILPSHLRKE